MSGRTQASCLLTHYNRRLCQPSLPATRANGASSEVHLRSPVRPSPCPARPDGSGLPWASPLCCRTLRYLALAGVRDSPGHWLEDGHEPPPLKLVLLRVAPGLIQYSRPGGTGHRSAWDFSRASARTGSTADAP